MNAVLYNWISLDGPALLTVTLCALTCALLGNYLIVRKMTMMGDALSHTVLPGIVLAFLVTGSRSSLPVILGAIAAGVLTSLLVELVSRHGDVEHGAAMGVVFVMFFALGVLLIEQAAARSVDLDADCILHGQLESIFWHPPREWNAFFSSATLHLIPAELISSFVVFCLIGLFQIVLRKELVLSSFDAALSDALGFSSQRMHHILMALVAAAAVVSFSSVGSIVVIAMLVCPPAAARLLTDTFSTQIRLSLLFAFVSSVGGYIAGAHLPIWLGYEHSINGAGAIGTMSGLLLLGAAIAAPKYGVAGKWLRDFAFHVKVAREDLLAELYRIGESARVGNPSLAAVTTHGLVGVLGRRAALRRGEVSDVNGVLTLTPLGAAAAEEVVRAHRLWESYLVGNLGLRPDHVHDRATELEHVTTEALQAQLAQEQNFPQSDPHGSPIPSVSLHHAEDKPDQPQNSGAQQTIAEQGKNTGEKGEQ